MKAAAITLFGTVAFMIAFSLAFYGGLIYFAFWCARYFDVI